MAPDGLTRYADPWELILTAVDQNYRSVDVIPIHEHAARHRWLNNAGGGYVGRWSNDEAPYLVGPMRALTSDAYLTTAVIGPAASGKSEIGLNWLQHAVETDPGDMLWYSATGPLVESWVKTRVDQLIRDHDGLRGALGDRPSDNSMSFKRFVRMYVEFLAATGSNFIAKRAPRLVLDEYDAYDGSLGDVHTLADARRTGFGAQSMILALSHPDRATGLDPIRDWLAGIMALYAASDRRTWWGPCPHCKGFSCFAPIGPRSFTLHYPEDAPLDVIAVEARLACPINGCLIENWQRRAMNLSGEWVGRGQEIDEDGFITGELAPSTIAGFWITGIMSPFLIRGIGGLASDLVAAQRQADVSGETKGLREVWAKKLGIPYQPPRRAGAVDADTLAERADTTLALGQVPDWVRFLTAAVDIQADRFEVLVRGWGRRGESVIIDVQRRPATPATNAAGWDDWIGDLFAARYPLVSDPSRGMAIKAIGYDSAGEPGVTQQAVDAWRRWRSKPGMVRRAGVIDGRDAWNLLPLKGQGQANAMRLAVVYPNSQRKDRNSAARGREPQGNFATNAFKDDLGGQLARAEPGPWYIHLPHELRGNWGAENARRSLDAPHTLLEQLVSERQDARGRWSKPNSGVRNEFLDLMVMSHVMAFLHGLTRINWDRPPAWALPHDANTLVAPLGDRSAQASRPSEADGSTAANEIHTPALQGPETTNRPAIVRRLA